MKKGTIVLLNGTSSSGKTSIAKELIKQQGMNFHHLSIDDFLKNYDAFIDQKFPDLTPVNELSHQEMARILFDPMASLYFSTVKLFSEMGLHVIADTVIENDKWFNECLEWFVDQPTLFVGVQCGREELARREKVRGDRLIGLANAQYDKVYRFSEYDIEVNTEQLNATECAEQILHFMDAGQPYTVFKKLVARQV